MATFLESTVMLITGLMLLLFFIKNVSQYKKSTGVNKTPLAFLAFLLLYAVLLPILIVAFSFFALYHKIVGLVLKCRFGTKFGGLLEGIDNIYANETISSVITILFNIEYNEDRYSQSLFDTVRKSAHNFFHINSERFPKLLNRFEKSMGYCYMLKNEMKVDNCIRKMQIVEGVQNKLNREDALRLIAKHSKEPLPENNTILWELVVGTQPVQWDKNQDDKTKTYPLLLRFHHCVGDGNSLLRMLVEAYADNPKAKILSPKIWKENLFRGTFNGLLPDNNNFRKSNENREKRIQNLWEQMRNMFEFLLMNLYVLILAPTSFFVQLIAAPDMKRNISSPKESILALNAEVSREYVEKVKKIKHKFPETSFVEVILTAFSSSFDEYFAKNSSLPPVSVKAVLPIPIKPSKRNRFLFGESSTDIKLQNMFSLIHINLPLHTRHSSDARPQITRLKLLQEQTRAFKKSIHGLVNYWLMSVAMANLPWPLTKCFQLGSCTSFISVFPGPQLLTFYGGSVARNFNFWFTTVAQTGVELSVITYDERLHIAVNADKTIIPDEKSVQGIIDGIYKYIDLMDEECL